MPAHEKGPYTLLPDVESPSAADEPTPQSQWSCFRSILVRISLAVMVLTLIRAAPRALRATGCHRGLATAPKIPTALPEHFILPSGDKIPAVALGVWKAPPDDARKAVTTALGAGYRHIDGAWAYRNEKEVGKAVSDSGLKRQDVWLTSKLWNAFHDPSKVESALDETLSHLGTDYLDLYLIHWPVAFRGDEKTKDGKPVIDEKLTADPYPTWQKMEEMVKKGKVRNIGVSNFNIARLRNLTANDLKITPAVNQVEINFWNPQPELVSFARESGLLLEAYSPLGGGDLVKDTLAVPEIKEAAEALDMTPAQVVVSWLVQRGLVVLPKSVTPSRVEENYKVKALPVKMFQKIEQASVAHEPKRSLNPSKFWGLDYDIFEDYPYSK